MKKGSRIYHSDEHTYQIIDNALGCILATIDFNSGNWILSKKDKGSDVYINDSTLREPQLLSKYDVIQIDGKKYYWADYLYEGRKQTLLSKGYLFTKRKNKSR